MPRSFAVTPDTCYMHACTGMYDSTEYGSKIAPRYILSFFEKPCARKLPGMYELTEKKIYILHSFGVSGGGKVPARGSASSATWLLSYCAAVSCLFRHGIVTVCHYALHESPCRVSSLMKPLLLPLHTFFTPSDRACALDLALSVLHVSVALAPRAAQFEVWQMVLAQS